MQSMNVAQCLAGLGFADGAEALATGWEQSQACLPDRIPFLGNDFLRRACGASCVSAVTARQVLAAADVVRSNACLRRLAWHGYHRLFSKEDVAGNPKGWPLPLEAMGDLAGFFYVIVMFSGTEQRERIHRERGIPDDVIRETVGDVEICVRTERQDELGLRPGIAAGILSWLLRHWRGRLYRLGRLQFAFGKFTGKARVYRHRAQGTVIAISEHGNAFRRDGQFNGAGAVADEEGGWMASLQETDESFAGFPISPRGHAVHREICLAKGDWEEALAPGDPILEIHMAAGEPMTYEACGDSFRRALEFFPRHYPEEPFNGFWCCSWLLDTQIDGLMPPDSNLVRFQRETYLVPLQGGKGDMPWQVQMDAGQTVPRSRMQRAFYGHVDRGGRFHSGGCFLLKDDVNWGAQVYRCQALPWEEAY